MSCSRYLVFLVGNAASALRPLSSSCPIPLGPPRPYSASVPPRLSARAAPPDLGLPPTPLLAALTALLVLWLVPHSAGNPAATGRTELRAFKDPQVVLTLLAGAIGFGGMFAMYTYIAPTVTEVAGLSESLVPLYVLAFGVGMVVGTPLAGRLSDWSVFRSMLVGSVLMCLTLVAFTVTSQWFVLGLVTVFLLSLVSSVLVVGLQMRLMQVAGDAQTIGAAMNHASLNIANALGAWLGGVVVAAGFGYTSTAWVGAGLSLAGLLVLLASAMLHRRTS